MPSHAVGWVGAATVVLKAHRFLSGLTPRRVAAPLLAPRQTPPSSREAARAGFAELVQDHGSGR